jgi:hypothetical protein
MAMTLVSTVTVGSGGASSVEFTSIPQTGKDLLLLVSGRHSTTTKQLQLRFNSDSASNYSFRLLEGDGANAGIAGLTANHARIPCSISTDTANTFGNTAAYVSNYTSSANKSFSIDGVSENNATTAYQSLLAYTWANSAAISSIQVLPNSGQTVAQHSTISLYIIS